jgi:hypothetical protein
MTKKTFTYNFQPTFAHLVQNGSKRQTIRKARKDGRTPKVGDTIRCYTGMRSRYCRHLRDAQVISVDHVVINDQGVFINGDRLGPNLDEFANADGFKNWAAMHTWFLETHGPDFWGFLIKW